MGVETASPSRCAARGGPKRVLRGGSWNNNPRNARAARRNNNQPDNTNDNNGFRVVVVASHDSDDMAGKSARGRLAAADGRGQEKSYEPARPVPG
jgi:hypothetical protein